MVDLAAAVPRLTDWLEPSMEGGIPPYPSLPLLKIPNLKAGIARATPLMLIMSMGRGYRLQSDEPIPRLPSDLYKIYLFKKYSNIADLYKKAPKQYLFYSTVHT